MHGVFIDIGANNNTVGGTVPGARNFIGGNGQDGVFINGNESNNNIVQGNNIGVGDEGDNFGNGGSGVHLASSTANNVIGGTQQNAGNVIGFNAVGVRLPDAGTGNRLLGNEIFGHTNLGIDLGASGVIANDAGDGDAGPNNLQNFPVLTSASVVQSNIAIQGTLSSTPSASFRIEFFVSTDCDTSGHGEGATFLTPARVGDLRFVPRARNAPTRRNSGGG
jgi:hypothetical protein